MKIPEPVKTAALTHWNDLCARRDSIVLEIKELEEFMRGHGILTHANENVERPDAGQSFSSVVRSIAAQMIVPGAYVKTEEIYEAVKASGVTMPPREEGKPDTARITRILSSSGAFKGHKSKGWSVKSEPSEELRSSEGSNATTSEQDDNI
ncbi:hypothetical protein [Paracidovorax cattleyae]|nr:hypothetical protein [Paracidovorax cattleyae]